ncbi:hypothetical protein J2X05_002253 [Cellvibrio fibrivorans]|uniref:Uncharacterized protein n=1 Tax=Cellvibrio fibrivorans TaxID=126350 RepID=A0ABU1UYJ4_9GAMM|nr:hypothetical protein [Cellvibrio fibrivorans]
MYCELTPAMRDNDYLLIPFKEPVIHGNNE